MSASHAAIMPKSSEQAWHAKWYAENARKEFPDTAAEFREYYVSRNLTYLAWQLYPSLSTKLFLARRLAARFAGVLLFSPDGFACAISLIRGIGDGLRGRMGIRTTQTLEYSGTRDEPLDPAEKTEAAHQ